MAFALLAGMACKHPDPGPKFLPTAEDGQEAAILLHKEFGLPAAPPATLEVLKPEKQSPGAFRLVVAEPGWRLDSPLEPLQIRMEEHPEATIFSWDLPPARVASWLGDKELAPLLLHIFKGEDHRPMLVACRATRLRPGEKAIVAGRAILLAPIAAFAVATSPILLPYVAAEGVHSALTPKPPEKPAPPPPLQVFQPIFPSFQPELESSSPDGPCLRIRIEGGSQTLAAMQEGFACFQPGLAPFMTQAPEEPDVFQVRLSEADLDRGRPFLLLHRGEVGGHETYALWAFYFSRKEGWMRSWCLLHR
jgi:hypothetical protein